MDQMAAMLRIVQHQLDTAASVRSRGLGRRCWLTEPEALLTASMDTLSQAPIAAACGRVRAMCLQMRLAVLEDEVACSRVACVHSRRSLNPVSSGCRRSSSWARGDRRCSFGVNQGVSLSCHTGASSDAVTASRTKVDPCTPFPGCPCHPEVKARQERATLAAPLRLERPVLLRAGSRANAAHSVALACSLPLSSS